LSIFIFVEDPPADGNRRRLQTLHELSENPSGTVIGLLPESLIAFSGILTPILKQPGSAREGALTRSNSSLLFPAAAQTGQ
jgi:hypothetical protein